MRNVAWMLGLILGVAVLLAGCSTSDPRSEERESSTAGSTAAPLSAHRSSPGGSSQPVPPYHKSATAAQPFPRLVPASYFRSRPLVAWAYEIAGQIPEVIAQQPCYCYCDKFGHRSLLDCYASDHGAG